MTPNFFDRVKALTAKADCHEHDIKGQTFKFYPVRVRWLWNGNISRIVKPLTKAISVLFESDEKDKERIRVIESLPTGDFRQEMGDDGEMIEVPIEQQVISDQSKHSSPELVQFRARRRDDAVQEAMEVLMDPQTLTNLARLLMDSLRDDFAAQPTDEEVQQFADILDFELLKEFMLGFFKANVSKMGPQLRKLADRVQDRMQSALATSPEEHSPTPSSSSDIEEDELRLVTDE